MMTKFTKAQLESAIIELLEAEGYSYVKGEAIARQPHEVIIEDDLRAFLAKHLLVMSRLSAWRAAATYENC